MLRATDEEHGHYEGQEEKAGDGQIRDFASLLGRLIEPFENGRGQQPDEQYPGANDDAVGPRQGLTARLDRVENDAGDETERDEANGVNKRLPIDQLEPFEARQLEPRLRRDVVL